MTEPCVCGRPASDHFMGFGPCVEYTHCGCRHFEADDGSRPTDSVVSSGRPSFPYDGTYSKHYTLEDEAS